MTPVSEVAAVPTRRNRQLAMVGGALGLFALGALATALVLDAPKKTETAPTPPAVTAKAPAKKPEAKPDSKPARTTPLDTEPAVAKAACATCGIVEAVTPVQVKGEGSGVGAVAGGVIGGVLGHQVGGGDGKKAMTVIGAVGGGLAGHEIEKRQRSTTTYQHKIRMADGSTRTVTQDKQIAIGQAVHVDGQQLTPMAAGGTDAPRVQNAALKS
jgi:outer membrane lipoprotein SlyB